MKLYNLSRVQKLPISREEAWEFFSNPNNLQEITPEDMSFQIVNQPSKEMYPGMIIEYKVSPFPKVTSSWVTEITHVKEGYYFVDEQRFGPYKFWHHQHHFREIENGVEMIDNVNYMMPASIIGTIVHKAIVHKRLNEIFDYRYKVLEEHFGHM